MLIFKVLCEIISAIIKPECDQDENTGVICNRMFVICYHWSNTLLYLFENPRKLFCLPNTLEFLYYPWKTLENINDVKDIL
jgi:hypothetical protein